MEASKIAAAEAPAIVVEHVDMNFRLNKNKTTSLKEWTITLLQKNLTYEDFFALKDVSFTVPKGQVLGLIGTNGSGKSTLLKVISGIYKPTGGTVRAAGRISPMVELGSGFDLELSGRENIFLNGAILGYDEWFLKDRFEEILEFSELQDFIEQPLKTYSSGMLMRLAFSVATIVEPDILIVDEILAVGDEKFQVKSLDRMQKLMKSGATVLMVSHNLKQIRNFCSRAIWLNRGHIRMDGDTEYVCEAYHEFQMK